MIDHTPDWIIKAVHPIPNWEDGEDNESITIALKESESYPEARCNSNRAGDADNADEVYRKCHPFA